MDSNTGRRAAWDTYLAVNHGLLRALRNGDSAEVINPILGEVVIRIRRYALMWPADGLMLIAAASGAVRLLRQDDREALIGLSVAMSRRLYLLSAGPDRLHHPGRRNQRAAWTKRAKPVAGINERRKARHRGQQHEKGLPDD
ncbi:hypothetical protein [Micromonospora inaquosa]|uniref:Uncharacterized protein n=1 Tax=Micromonospora inaquosa TaxID=2203716 RepID=A0A3N9WT47_9ACTN|nr:hypothetical protein [Micromonospora inaquosa]RQX03879.1 hypothetical protein DLJ59_11250 [Micromonospora inaquosa]